jgi:hypothetical protein
VSERGVIIGWNKLLTLRITPVVYIFRVDVAIILADRECVVHSTSKSFICLTVERRLSQYVVLQAGLVNMLSKVGSRLGREFSLLSLLIMTMWAQRLVKCYIPSNSLTTLADSRGI